jgi:putative flippase GtrA
MSLLELKLESFLKRTSVFTRFLLVGVVNTLTGLSIIFGLLNVFGFSYWISTFVGNCIGALVSYLLNRTFTFNSQISFTKGVPRFITVILICYFLSFSLSEFVADEVYLLYVTIPSINEDEFAILLGSSFYTISNFFGQRNFVFKK